MGNYPKVTIITPSLNQGQFIENTILSVINQDYPNIEYIIMDGGSTDNTLNIIKKYDYAIVYWESRPDKGEADAINKGLKIATGKYVGWLCSDDYLEQGVIWDIVKAFEDPEVGTVCGKLRIINEKGEFINYRFSTVPITFDNLLNGNAQILQPGSFHRLELFQRYGYLDENLNYAMDYELWLRFGKYSTFKQLDKIVANHRFHEKSKTITAYAKFIPEIKRIRKKYGGKMLCAKSIGIFRYELIYLFKKILRLQ